MADNDCLPQVFVCRTRVGQLDLDGTPNGNLYVSDALQRVTFTPVYDDGDEIKEKNGCGATFVDVLADPTFTRIDWEMEFLSPDPLLHAILLSGGALLSASGGRSGFRFPRLGTVSGQVSLEFWTERIDDGNLAADFPYAHWAAPYAKSIKLGPRELSNTAQHAVLNGQMLESANFFDGPANDWPSADAPAVAALQWIDSATAPDAACEYVAIAGS